MKHTILYTAGITISAILGIIVYGTAGHSPLVERGVLHGILVVTIAGVLVSCLRSGYRGSKER